jgi:hypothetical protein
MSEHAPAPVSITALRVGRTDVGPAAASVDDDALTIVVRIDAEERSLRLRLASIDVVTVSGEEVDIMVRDGRHVLFRAPDALRDQLFERSRALPELTRTLRAFGSSRARRGVGGRASEGTEQQRFFAPFLDARRSVGALGGHPALAAFRAAELARALADTLGQFAAERHPEPGPARRALEAELIDASEPLFDALTALGETADAALAAEHDLRRWRAWSAQLRATFETADRVWVALDDTLEAAHREAVVAAARKNKTGWKAR